MNQQESPGVPKSSRRIPWWVSILMAIGSYCSLKFVVPVLQLEDPTWQKLAQAAPSFAPLVTIPFLLLAAKQLYDTDIGEKEDDGSECKEEEDPKE